MLDKKDSHVAILADLLDQAAEPSDFVVIETAGGLIKQQELRLRGERACELDALLRAEGEAAHRPSAYVGEVEIGDQITCFADHRGFAASHCRKTQGITDEIAAALRVAADENIVEHGQMLEEGDVLECAPDPEFRNPVRWAVQDRAPFK